MFLSRISFKTISSEIHGLSYIFILLVIEILLWNSGMANLIEIVRSK